LEFGHSQATVSGEEELELDQSRTPRTPMGVINKLRGSSQRGSSSSLRGSKGSNGSFTDPLHELRPPPIPDTVNWTSPELLTGVSEWPSVQSVSHAPRDNARVAHVCVHMRARMPTFLPTLTPTS
jgi:hypothetical protein